MYQPVVIIIHNNLLDSTESTPILCIVEGGLNVWLMFKKQKFFLFFFGKDITLKQKRTNKIPYELYKLEDKQNLTLKLNSNKKSFTSWIVLHGHCFMNHSPKSFEKALNLLASPNWVNQYTPEHGVLSWTLTIDYNELDQATN